MMHLANAWLYLLSEQWRVFSWFLPTVQFSQLCNISLHRDQWKTWIFVWIVRDVLFWSVCVQGDCKIDVHFPYAFRHTDLSFWVPAGELDFASNLFFPASVAAVHFHVAFCFTWSCSVFTSPQGPSLSVYLKAFPWLAGYFGNYVAVSGLRHWLGNNTQLPACCQTINAWGGSRILANWGGAKRSVDNVKLILNYPDWLTSLSSILSNVCNCKFCS